MIFTRLLAIVSFISWTYLILYTFKTLDYTWIVVSLVYYKIVVGLLGNQVAQHRYFSHRSFVVSRGMKHFLYYISLTTGVSPRDYAIIHRHHHLYSDLAEDVHSHYNSCYDIFFPLTGHKKHEGQIHISGVLDAELKKINRQYKLIIILTAGLFAVVSFQAMAFIFLSGIAWNYIHMILFRVFLVHTRLPFSYRNYETNDQSWNNKVLQALDIGEGLHNNHHFKPENYNQAHRQDEFDFAAFIIKHFIELRNEST